MNPTTITASARGEAVVLKVEGDLTDQSKLLLEAVEEQLRQGRKKIVVDLSGSGLLNSLGLGYLVGAFTRVRNNGGTIVLAGLPEKTRDVLQVTKLYTVYPTYDSVDAGLAELQKP